MLLKPPRSRVPRVSLRPGQQPWANSNPGIVPVSLLSSYPADLAAAPKTTPARGGVWVRYGAGTHEGAKWRAYRGGRPVRRAAEAVGMPRPGVPLPRQHPGVPLRRDPHERHDARRRWVPHERPGAPVRRPTPAAPEPPASPAAAPLRHPERTRPVDGVASIRRAGSGGLGRSPVGSDSPCSAP
jgi:hypothetical protein